MFYIEKKYLLPEKYHGFSLVEVMVALFVLSLGLLGMAGLQLGGMQSTKSAYTRTQATMIAYDIIDRMRTNAAGLTNNQYQPIDCTAPPSKPACIGTSSGCTATDLAKDDINEWCNTRVDSLPGGTGTVNFASPNYTVKVGWTEASDADNPNKSVTVHIRFK